MAVKKGFDGGWNGQGGDSGDSGEGLCPRALGFAVQKSGQRWLVDTREGGQASGIEALVFHEVADPCSRNVSDFGLILHHAHSMQGCKLACHAMHVDYCICIAYRAEP